MSSQWLRFYEAGHVLLAAGYCAAAWSGWRALGRGESGNSRSRHLVIAALLVAHALLLGFAVAGETPWRFGFAHALSATLLVAVLVIWLEGLFVPVRAIDVLVLPVAALAALLPGVFEGSPLTALAESATLRLHLSSAILAYSLLTIAALHAALMAVLDRRLHAPAAPAGAMGRVLAKMPPLLALERLLFHLIAFGFALLTVTLVSGALYTEQRFGQWLRFDHKTVFTIASWLMFGGLLLGRQVFGWRGRTALRWIFGGFALLMLAYVGSRFVVEVVLQRA
jgi:ABC-type uncharacterized transport system permease subunit